MYVIILHREKDLHIVTRGGETAFFGVDVNQYFETQSELSQEDKIGIVQFLLRRDPRETQYRTKNGKWVIVRVS